VPPEDVVPALPVPDCGDEACAAVGAELGALDAACDVGDWVVAADTD